MSGPPARRRRRGVTGTLPWRRAPLLLLRRPAVFLALVGASMVLAAAAASGPMFLSTVGTATLHAEATQSCPEDVEPGLTATATGTDVPRLAARGVAAVRAQGLPSPDVTVVGEATVRNALVHLFAGPRALEHVTTLTPRRDRADRSQPGRSQPGRGQPGRGSGVWVPDNFVPGRRLHPGDRLTLESGRSVRVAGIYRALAPHPFELADLAPYWCRSTSLIVTTAAADASVAATPPSRRQGALLITDPATVARVAQGRVRLSWHSPMSTTSHPLADFETAAARARRAAAALGARADPELGANLGRAVLAREGVAGSVVPIEAAGIAVAGLLVAGAGWFWSVARRREIRLLATRGVGPGALAGKAALETVLPIALGGAAGVLLTASLVGTVGPATVFDAGSSTRAAVMAGLALAVALVLIAGIGALAGRLRTTGRRAGRLGRVPWELVLIVVAGGIALLGRPGSGVTIDHAIVGVDAQVVLFPLLGALGVLLLLGRLVAAVLPALGGRADSAPRAAYLALRRLTRSRALAAGMVVGTALPCCLLMYGSTVRTTVIEEVGAKTRTTLGAPTILLALGLGDPAVPLHGDGTQVLVYDQDATLGGQPVTVLGIDPDTFARYAYVDAEQQTLVRRLRPDPADGVRPGTPLPAIVVNSGGGSAVTDLTLSRTRFALSPVASTAVFPGLRHHTSPLVVVDRRRLATVDDAAEFDNQFWTDPSHEFAVREQLRRDGDPVVITQTARVVVSTTGLLPITWIFGYLQALAALVGLVAVAGLVFGLAARARTRRVSYVMSRRMGMTRATHVRSVLVELAVVVGSGWLAGTALGVASFTTVYRRLDVYPSLLPPPTFVVPSTPLVVSGGIVLVVIALATAATQWVADRTRPAEILRLE